MTQYKQHKILLLYTETHIGLTDEIQECDKYTYRFFVR